MSKNSSRRKRQELKKKQEARLTRPVLAQQGLQAFQQLDQAEAIYRQLLAISPPEEELEEVGLGPDSASHPGGDELLLGLYQGIPLTERTSDYGLVLPDTITLYRECMAEEIVVEVQQTIKHEIAHYFGLSDERLEELGAY